MLQAITNLDLSILLEIQEHLRCGFSDVIFPLLSKLNNAGFIWIVITLFLLYRKKTRTAGLCMAACLLVNLALGEGILKHLINRARPFVVHPISQMLIAQQSGCRSKRGGCMSGWKGRGRWQRNQHL